MGFKGVRNGESIRVVPPRLEHMMIRKYVSRRIDQKTGAEDVQVYGSSVAFGGHDRIATLVEQRTASCIDSGKLQLRSRLFVVKAKHHVDQAHAIGVVLHDLLCDARLGFQLADA